MRKDIQQALAYILPKSCYKYCGRNEVDWMDASTISYLEEIPDTSEPSVDDGLGVYELTKEMDDAPENTFEFRKVLQHFDEQTPITAEKTEDLKLGTEEPKKVLISGTLSPTDKEHIVAILREYVDVFAWSYEDMPGLD